MEDSLSEIQKEQPRKEREFLWKTLGVSLWRFTFDRPGRCWRAHPSIRSWSAQDGSLMVRRRYGQTTAEGVLAPLAEAAAAFLATADFDLVRACEGVDCVLWFVVVLGPDEGPRAPVVPHGGMRNPNEVATFRSGKQP